MGNWGSQRFQANSAPNWYTKIATKTYGDSGGANTVTSAHKRPNHPADGFKLEVTERGWERVLDYIDSSGRRRIKREVVVADRNLANTIAYGSDVDGVASPSIVGMYWANTTYINNVDTGATPTIYVKFSEPVVADLSDSTVEDIPRVRIQDNNGVNQFLYLQTGNGTSTWGFSHDATSNCSGEATYLFVRGDGGTAEAEGTPIILGVNAATPYGNVYATTSQMGRESNTVTQDTNRVANVSSRGVTSNLTGSDVQGEATYVADVGVLRFNAS